LELWLSPGVCVHSSTYVDFVSFSLQCLHAHNCFCSRTRASQALSQVIMRSEILPKSEVLCCCHTGFGVSLLLCWRACRALLDRPAQNSLRLRISLPFPKQTTRLDRRSGGVLSLGECGDRNGNPSHNFTRRTQPRAVAEVAEVPQLIAPGLVVHIGGLAATNLWLAEAQNRLIKVGVTWPAGSYTSPNETHSVLGPSVLGTVFFYCSSLQTAGLS